MVDCTLCEQAPGTIDVSFTKNATTGFAYTQNARTSVPCTALGLSSLISSKLLKKMLMYSWMEEQSPAEKIKIFLEKNYEKY